MGIFSSHRRNSSNVKDRPVHGQLYVFARSSTPASQHGEGSIEPEIFWSLAVEDLCSNAQQPIQDVHSKRRKSMFSMRRGSRKSSTASDQTEIFVRPTEPTYINEYTFRDGTLYTSHGESSQDSTDGMQPSLLVKARLQHSPQDTNSNQPLTAKIEHLLYSMTSANSHLANEQTETWIRYALISLQHAKVLPHGHIFDVNNFINYIQNRTTEFEAGLLSASTQEREEGEEGTEIVREIDYQSHLDEDARLKALFSNRPLDNLDDNDDDSRRSSMIEGPPGIRGGFGGGFWISRPQGATRMKGDSSIYGGLM